MRIKQELFERNSMSEFEEAIRARVDACAGITHIRTKEVQRAALATRQVAFAEGSLYREWDINRGFVDYVPADYTDCLKKGTPCPQVGEAFKKMFDDLPKLKGEDSIMYITMVDPSKFWEAPNVVDWMRKAAYVLPQTNVRLMIITPDNPPPDILSDLMSTVRLDPPGFSELMEKAEILMNEHAADLTFVGMDDDSKKALCYAASGMTLNTFEDTLSLAISNNHDGSTVEGETLIRDVGLGKTEVVNKNDILELYKPEDMGNVGGMENLKEWIRNRADCYSDEAADFGIEPPKGMVFVGPPGTGKSLAAKAVASEFRVPLVRLDFGRVFNSLVGASEERIREALKMCEHMAPVVLFVDEIDKGLGGAGGGGDSGTSSRVLGTFLTWLNDCEAPVFTMVTANNIAGLPPELMRRGRFDGIFATGLPTPEERLEVLKIHMSKRGWNPDDYKKADLNKVVTASKGYVGAEIEAAVKDGLILAYNNGDQFECNHMLEALKVMVPLSKSYEEQIQLMTAWAKQNAIPASKRYDETTADNVTPLTGRRTRVRKKKDD